MAIQNENRVITVAGLADFLGKLKNNVLNAYLKVADLASHLAGYALKTGGDNYEFNVKKLVVNSGNIASVANKSVTLSVVPRGDLFTPKYVLKFLHSSGKSVYLDVDDGYVLTGVLGFNTHPNVSVYSDLDLADPEETPTYTPESGQISNITNINGSIVYVSGVDGAESGFHIVNESDQIRTLTFLCAPDKYSLYYNQTTESLQQWTGVAFSNIATGGTIVIDDDDYVPAQPGDINSVFGITDNDDNSDNT